MREALADRVALALHLGGELLTCHLWCLVVPTQHWIVAGRRIEMVSRVGLAALEPPTSDRHES